MKIGLIDSGCDIFSSSGVFIFMKDDNCELKSLKKDNLMHGTTLASLIGSDNASFICAQVFDEELITSAQTVAFAVNYLIKENVDLIHTSLGLQHDREVLRTSIQKAVEKGITVVASSPTLSKFKTYPACYSNVVSVCADARCYGNDFSYINTSHALIGASPYSDNEKVRGSSVSAAYVTKELARLYTTGITKLEEQLEFIKNNAKFKIAQSKLSFKVN